MIIMPAEPLAVDKYARCPFELFFAGNYSMIQIRPIKREEIPVAKELIYRVAYEIFHDTRPLEESIAFYEAQGALDDMGDVQSMYFDRDGIFLVMIDAEQMIGTGAVRKINDETCELKRVWLLIEHHGKGLGYHMMQELLAFAREK